MKPTSFDEKKPFTAKHRFRRQQGFALIVSLSLMVLITVLAVGLLTLSSVSMRASTHTEAMQAAKGNARLALMLAIGQLQKNAGPDQRISAPANLINENMPHGVAGVWKSWRTPNDGTGDYAAEKKNRFAGYVMSAPDFESHPDPSQIPGGDSKKELMVGEGSLGKSDTSNREIRAPLVNVGKTGGSDAGSLAWVALDEGVKGRIDLLPDKDTSTSSPGKNITRVGSSPRNKVGKLEGLETLNEEPDKLFETLPKLVSSDEVNLMSSNKETFGRYFHDFSVTASSVQADVANGGLKTDLSVLFDTAALGDYTGRRLYSGTTTGFGGSNSDPQWGIYQHYYRLYQRATANDNPKDGMKTYVTARYKQKTVRDTTLGGNRIEPDMSTLNESVIMPTIAKVDIVFSMVARDAHGPWPGAFADPAGTYPYMLHLMYLPVITLHNPYNVPIRFTQLEIEFEDIPMGFKFLVNGQSATSEMVAFNQMHTGDRENGKTKKFFRLVLTGDIAAAREIVMPAGETRIFGKPFPPALTWAQDVAANGGYSFDWDNNKTGSETGPGNKIAPGMITGFQDGIGYDLDWLAPSTGVRQPWFKARYKSGQEGGCFPLKPSDVVSVQYGPKSQLSSPNKFAVTMRLTPGNATNNYSTTQVFFKDDARLKAILEEGVTQRFPKPRSFPETYPKAGVDPARTAAQIYETNGTAIKDYAKARPFAIFSLSGKTTKDSFTRSRPVADTGITAQMATCDFTSSASQGSSPYEFVLTPFPSQTGGFEVDGVKGFFFGGHGKTNGTTNATIYEIPQAPLQSIAQMRHANAASLGSAPYFTYSVGESRAHPALPITSVKFAPNTTSVMLDHSWLANDALWDKYWFSTLATLQGTGYTGSDATSQTQLANSFFNGERDLPNPRNTPHRPSGMTVADAAAASIADRGIKTGAYVMTKGGFNVNSVSKTAWISVLSALSDSTIQLASGALEQTDENIPVLRTRRPTGGLKDARDPKSRAWNSYRNLTPEEVDALAEQIVVEVRERGPFLSMSDFVNRRLTDGALGQKGALQAAIDRCQVGSRKLNDGMDVNSMPIVLSEVASYGWKNPGALADTNTGAGAPGEISQGDLLSAIGSFTTVRSDTFRIRAFGDARDKDGNVLARAWCEATVQRFPEYVDQTDKPEVAATTEANKAFGRRFSVVAFRWLHPDEV